MLHSSYIEISKSALQHNIDFLKKEIGAKVKLSSVIKGNAYGHGIEQFAPIAQESGIDHFSVFSADEAYRLLEALPETATTLIMGYIDNSELEWAIQHDIEFFVFELDRLLEALKVAKKLNKKARIHLELETGMNRTGFEKGALELAEAILLKNKEYIELKGICTHYAGAESMRNNDRVQAQYNKFTTIVEQLKSNSLHPDQLHSACSAAMISYPESRMDMVRIGIMQYGFWPSSETFRQYIANKKEKKDPLRRLINWKSRIMSLKTVSKGDYIGYGSSFQAPYDMVLAIIPIGYAWGYSRSLSNQGHVLISGKRANVVGMINMNIMMVDVTEIKDVEKNDEVVLLGNQKNESITVASFGELSTQLNYELLTRLPAGIPRKIVA